MGCSKSRSEKLQSSKGLRLKDRIKSIYPLKEKQQIKLVLLGDAGVGKSSIAHKYIQNQFKETYQVSVGGVYFPKDVILSDNTSATLHIWDTGGQQRYRNMASLDAAIALLIYDITQQNSFNSIDYWINVLDQKRQKQGMVLIMVGNKCDAQNRNVNKQIALEYGKKMGIKFFQTSAKTGEGINQMFEQIIQDYYIKKKK